MPRTTWSRITVRDLTKLGDTVDAAVDAGATQVNGITFRVDDQTKVEAQAREAAMKDAKGKADALAAAAGVNITGVASISEVSSPTPGPIYYAIGGLPHRWRATSRRLSSPARSRST